jgi:hypothetical protein
LKAIESSFELDCHRLKLAHYKQTVIKIQAFKKRSAGGKMQTPVAAFTGFCQIDKWSWLQPFCDKNHKLISLLCVEYCRKEA